LSAVIAEGFDLVFDGKVYARTVDDLRRWAREKSQMRRSILRSLQVPAASSMSHMMEAQRVFAKQRKANPTRRAMRCPECQHIYFGNACTNCNALAVNGGVTARGTPTRSMVPPAMVLQYTSRSATVNFVVEALRGAMRKVIYAAYYDDLPDRLAARNVGMTREDFSRWHRAAVAYIAEQLAKRGEKSVYSLSPTRARGDA
jgi:hypothetical protein